MRDETPSVLIVDDDPEFRDSVARLLRTVGVQTRNFRPFPISSRPKH